MGWVAYESAVGHIEPPIGLKDTSIHQTNVKNKVLGLKDTSIHQTIYRGSTFTRSEGKSFSKRKS